MRVFVPSLCVGMVLVSTLSLRAAETSYTKDVRPFLDTYCIDCHKGMKAKAGVNLETFESTLKASRKGTKVVVPGDADKSLLVTTVEGKGGKKMPPKKATKQPTEKEIEVLRAWIAAGAKDDTAK